MACVCVCEGAAEGVANPASERQCGFSCSLIQKRRLAAAAPLTARLPVHLSLVITTAAQPYLGRDTAMGCVGREEEGVRGAVAGGEDKPTEKQQRPNLKHCVPRPPWAGEPQRPSTPHCFTWQAHQNACLSLGRALPGIGRKPVGAAHDCAPAPARFSEITPSAPAARAACLHPIDLTHPATASLLCLHGQLTRRRWGRAAQLRSGGAAWVARDSLSLFHTSGSAPPTLARA